MNIVFWSCRAGMARVSSSMLAIASMSAIYYKYQVSAMQTQFNCNSLQYPFFKIEDKENVERYSSTGMDSFLRTVKGESNNLEAIRNCGISFLGKKLTVYTQSTSADAKVYLHDLSMNLANVFHSLGSAFDISFIDTLAGNDPITMKALQKADVIVICFPQANWVIDYFYSKYKLSGGKVFYLFGDYDKDSECNIKKFLQQHKKTANKKNVGIIPHCIDYQNALNKSEIVNFMLKNYECTDHSPVYDFIYNTRETTEKLLTFAGLDVEGR